MEFNIYLFAIFLEILIFSCGMDASCDIENCRASNGTRCNYKGDCDCGVCSCYEGYSGPTCEECATCASPCDVFRACVGCKIFGTGPKSIMDCLNECDDIATYLPEYGKYEEPVSPSEKITCHTVRKMSRNKFCRESFLIGDMSQGYRNLYVYTEVDCSIEYKPTEGPVIEVTVDLKEENEMTTTTRTKIEIDVDNKVHDEDDKDDVDNDTQKHQVNASPVSGSSRGNSYDNNSADTVRFSVYSILLITLSVLFS